MNILITGITGMLGRAVSKYFLQSIECNLYGVSRQANYFFPGVNMFYGDLSSVDFVKSMEHISFDAIIHCSAEVNVNLCDANKELAYKSNVDATANVFSHLKAQKYVYISTDSVFDGKMGNYLETSEVNPLNYYAETKLLGENSVKALTYNHYILRTNIYGHNTPMKGSLFEWCYSELNKNNEVNGFSNMFFNPMYVGQLAELIEQLIINNIEFGTYNISCTENISKYEFLLKVADVFNFSSSLIHSHVFKQNNLNAVRALNTTLNNSKIQSAFKDFDFSLSKGFSMLKKDFKNE